MKRVGILGGLGPETTAEFYLTLNHLATTAHRPDIGIESLPIDLQKEQEYIASGAHGQYYLELLRRGALHLAHVDCDFIVIPCNTVHEFHAEIAQSVDKPVVNLIQVVAREIYRRRWKKVVLLATSRTIQTGLYQRILARNKIEVRVPTLEDQRKLDRLIQGILGDRKQASHQSFLENLVAISGTKNIVLGCTDLQLLFPPTGTIIDSMTSLALHTSCLLI